MTAAGAVVNCQAVNGICFVAAVLSTSLLSFFRGRAIFRGNKWIVAFFALLWLGTVAGSAIVLFTVTTGHIGPTDHCTNTGTKPLSSMGITIIAVNGTLVFFAISWRLPNLSSSTIDESFKAKAKVFLSGNGLPSL